MRNFPNETDIPRASWEALQANVHALISVSGIQRQRIQRQFLQYKQQAAEWRRRLLEASSVRTQLGSSPTPALFASPVLAASAVVRFFGKRRRSRRENNTDPGA
jgi:hypothetical protein